MWLDNQPEALNVESRYWHVVWAIKKWKKKLINAQFEN